MNERINMIRKKLGLTLDKFGDKLGVSKQAISRIEHGVSNVTEQMIKSICREFNVNETWLRTGEGEMFVDMDTEDELMRWAGEVLSGSDTSFQKRFVKMLMGLNPAQWKVLEEKILELYEKQDKEN